MTFTESFILFVTCILVVGLYLCSILCTFSIRDDLWRIRDDVLELKERLHELECYMAVHGDDGDCADAEN